MIRQYPYELFKWVAGGDSYQDAHGNWVVIPGSWQKMGMCRDEVNGKGSYVTMADGSAYVFDFLIQISKSIRVMEIGAKIEVRDGSNVRVSAEVKRFDPSQLHSRLWV